MSRKQSAVQRIRKKASTTSASRTGSSSDPYHNGETPSCRLLVDAVQDIFPELYADRTKRIQSSEFGQLLRWQVLKRRQEREFPPALPLTSPETSEAVNDSEGMNENPDSPSAATKKKRKKKRKKKENNGELSGTHLALRLSEESGNGEGLLSGTIIEHENGASEAPLLYDDEENDEPEIVSLKEDEPSKPKRKFDPSVNALDRSLHEMEEERCRCKDESTPDLGDLPSDDGDTEFGWDTRSHISTLSFDEIPQESTERGDEDSVEMPVPMSFKPSSTATRSASLRRSMSASSFESGGGASTPKKAALGNSDHCRERNQISLSSPTHEWVPVEHAEAKNETPPADIIRNPLSLPYLLTLNTDNGMTTLTINGKLIYAEKANAAIEDYQLGSLEATKLLLEDWLGQVVIHRMKRGKDVYSTVIEHDAGDFLGYVQEFLKDGSRPREIPFKHLVEALEQIECSACRSGVSKVIDEWSNRGEDKPLVLNPRALDESPCIDDTEVDAAFDYVALEEGHHHPQQPPPALEDGADVDPEKHMSFSVRSSDPKNSADKCLLVEHISHVHLNTFVETWLPCGIDEEDLVNTSIIDQMSLDGSNAATVPEVLDPEEANRMQQRILRRIQMAQTELSQIQMEGRELLNDLETLLSGGAAAKNIDISAFTKIKTVDDKCTAFKGRINLIVRRFSDGVECAGEHLKLQLWTAYLEALNKALKSCDQYYEKLAETADQRGKLPNVFVSAPFRALVQDLVKDKILSWTSFSEFIGELFSGAALQEYITRMVWHTERDVASVERSGTATVLYKMCNELAVALATWTETIVGSKMGDIYQARVTQTEQILEQLQHIIEPLSEEYATVEKYFSTERNLYFASLRSNVVLAQGVKKRMRLIDNAEVEGMVTGVLLMWTHVRLMQNRMIHSVRIPQLPLQLKRFMLQDARSMHDSLEKTDATHGHSHHQRHCYLEVKSKRKALCILAGLVYRWLRESFDLWRAQKAEAELLKGFDVDQPPKVAIDIPKPAKSKKSKKKKAQKPILSSDLQSVIIVEEVADSADSNGNHHDGNLIVLEEVADSANGNLANVESELENMEKDPEQADGVDDYSLGLTTKEATELEEGTAPESSDSMTDPEFYEEYQLDSLDPKVFIEDGADRIAAEDFLIARLRHFMLELGKTEKIILIS